MSDEYPYQLPTGWRWAKLSDVGKIVSGGTPSTKDPSNFGGDIPWLTPADLTGYTDKYISSGKRNITKKGLDSSSAAMMPKDAVLFSSRAPIGYVAIASNPISTNQGFKSIVLDGAVEPEYAYYYLKGSKALAESRASGTTFKEISGRRFGQLPIPVAPLDEQRRIVDKIEELFSQLNAGVEALEKVQVLLKRYRQSVLKAAVEGKLTEAWREQHKDEIEPASVLLERILAERRAKWEADQLAAYEANGKKPPKDWRERYEEPVAPDTSDLPELPEGWVWASVDQLIHTVTSGSRGWKKYLGSGEAKFVLVQNVQPGRLVFDPPTCVDPPKGSETDRTRVDEGDILVTIVGRSGTVAVARSQTGLAYVSQSVALLRPVHANTANYLEKYLQCPQWGRDLLTKNEYGMGRSHLLLSHIRETPVVLPTETEQRMIVNLVNDNWERTEIVDDDTSRQIGVGIKLRQSVLKAAFEGQL